MEFKSPLDDKVNYQQLRQAQVIKLRSSLRVGQTKLVDWSGGSLAISAVPGAGKSHSLAVAAALTIAKYQLHARKQLIIVTYTRSAAASIKNKIRDRLKQLYLPPGGFRVQTLHGLALNIANSHPELSGLNLDESTLVIPTPSHRVIRATVEQWIANHPQLYQVLLAGAEEFDGEETERLRRQSVLRTEILPQLAHTAIRESKSSGLLPKDLAQIASYSRDAYQILQVASGLYQEYQAVMQSRGLIDYDDMILAALQVLEEPPVLRRWQSQVFGVFEDEAQDSSPLQEKLITLLAKDPDNYHLSPNLIRVGDPNQAINSTFTPADPVYFNWFCQVCQTEGNLGTMKQAGRSSKVIIEAANLVLQWVNQLWHSEEKDLDNCSASPFRWQKIEPVDSNDPQPEANPTPVGKGLEIYYPPDIHHTVKLIKQRIIDLLAENPHHNIAILVRENRQGRFVAQNLADLKGEKEIKVYEVSELARNSQVPLEILALLKFLDRPHSVDNLKAALEVLQNRGLIPSQDLNVLATQPENFLYPTPLVAPPSPRTKETSHYCRSLLKARLELPPYQLIPFLGMTLRYSGSELATVEKLGERIEAQIRGKSSLKSIISSLEEIVTSEKFEAIEENADEQYTRPGQVTIITMHKAKGLDWDYVFIPFLQADTLPGKPRIPNAHKFLGDFDLGEIARSQIRASVHYQYQKQATLTDIPHPQIAWQEAIKLKKAEEYRLLYVAMTRAKRLLWLSAAKEAPFSWNVVKSDTPTNLQAKQPCPILPVLAQHFPDSLML